jgi:Mg2+-importing ATPase
MPLPLDTFWNLDNATVLQQLQTVPEGLSSDDAARRLDQYGPNLLKPKKRTDALTLLIGQFKSPIILVLMFAAVLSYFLGDKTDAVIIMVIVLVSGLLGFWQEKGAADAVARLLSIVQTTVTVKRDGRQVEIPVENVVPGDIILLTGGAIIPGDCLILESKDLFVDEATLTGETFPAEKAAGRLPEDTPLAKRTNSLFMGTHVVSGTGTAVVIQTGLGTEFGRVSQHLKLRPPETEFERGIRRFGYFLIEVTLVLVFAIFVFNVYLKRPILDSFLFAMALAVGLTPQLLPAIISVNLSHGARRLAAKKVIVRRLASIENFGSMSILCSDKTGTLTEGTVKVRAAVDVHGRDSETVLHYAYINAACESGFVNPIDEAVRNHRKFDLSPYRKLDEIPYDFIRKRKIGRAHV